jgi:hypothetical protein
MGPKQDACDHRQFEQRDEGESDERVVKPVNHGMRRPFSTNSANSSTRGWISIRAMQIEGALTLTQFSVLLPRGRIPTKRRIDCVQQLLLPVGLLQEIHGAVADGLAGGLNVHAAADKHDWKTGPHFNQALLQRDPFHPRHAHIQHQAAAPSTVEGGQELEPGAEDRGRKSDRDDQLSNRVATSVVVVNYEYGGFAQYARLEALVVFVRPPIQSLRSTAKLTSDRDRRHCPLVQSRENLSHHNKRCRPLVLAIEMG